MPLRVTAVTVVALLFLSMAQNTYANPDAIQADEKTLGEAGLATDGAALLEFFRKRTLADAHRDQILDLIKKMGDDSFQVRERAFADLLAFGPTAAPLLRQAQQTATDIEIVRRAERCLELIEKNHSIAIAAAATRLLADRKPEDTVEVLLAYLPFADDESIIEEVRNTLLAVGVREGKADQTLVEALQDKLPLRRGIAAEVLGRSEAKDLRPTLHKLLKDPDISVRLRVALALVENQDKQAMPTLIALLTELPRTQCWRVEDLLYRLAGDDSPKVALGATEEERIKYRDAWAAWWTKNQAKIDLAKLDEQPSLMGHMLLVEMTQGVNGRVREVSKDGKARWEIGGLQYPVDAQVISPARVLVVEYTPRRVSERDMEGNIKWQRTFAGTAYPMNAQRLKNGNTFIATRNQLLEVDKDNKEVFSHNRPASDITAADKTRDGHYVFVTRTGQCIRIDGTGKEVKSFPVGPVQLIGTNIEALPNGNVLIPQSNTNKVVEFDSSGKSVWEVQAVNPTSVARLPNGNTLIGGMNNQQIIEVDRSGKEVRQLRSEGRLTRVRIR